MFATEEEEGSENLIILRAFSLATFKQLQRIFSAWPWLCLPPPLAPRLMRRNERITPLGLSGYFERGGPGEVSFSPFFSLEKNGKRSPPPPPVLEEGWDRIIQGSPVNSNFQPFSFPAGKGRDYKAESIVAIKHCFAVVGGEGEKRGEGWDSSVLHLISPSVSKIQRPGMGIFSLGKFLETS